MKKSPFRNKGALIFWLLFVVGCLWIAFVPPSPPLHPPGVTVKVSHSSPQPAVISSPVPETVLPNSGGEEQTPMPKKPEAEPGISVTVQPEHEAPVPKQKPKIAIVIDDVGVDMKGSEKAIHLPAPVTLSFLPYATRLREQAKQARDNGHELLLHMPMEPVGHEDPGPGALLVNLPLRDLQQRFETALASFTGFDGVNNHMGSKFSAYPEGMGMVMDELQQRHLFYLDSRTSAQSVGQSIAEQKGLPTIGRDVFLDDEQSPDAIRTQLDATEHIARRKGYAVAIGHPHAATMEVLPGWIEDMQKKGVELVPLNALVEHE